MNKKELISKVADVLRTGDVRKPLPSNKTVFHIVDDHGNQTDFTIRNSEKGLLYTADDVSAIIDACLSVVEDALKRGEEVSIYGFGTLGLNHRAARQTKHPDTGEAVTIKERYVPKFNYGNILRMAARTYEETAGGKGGV